MNRFSAIDEPVALSQMVEEEQLVELLASIAKLSPVTITVKDRVGEVVASCGVLNQERQHRQVLQYCGDMIGSVLVSPSETGATPDLEATATHIVAVLQSLVHASYGRYVTTAIHQAAMEESFSELSDRNKRLASAIERLEELERLKSNFLSTISHELRTPLTSVMGYSEMLIEGLAGELSEEQNDYVQTILDKSEHLLQLITGILDVSLIEARSLRLAFKPVDISELVAGVAKTMARDLERRNILLDLPTELVPRALGDAPKLRQVILHLLANAIKFSPEGGDVKIVLGVGPLSAEDNSTPNSPFWRDKLSERFGLRVTVSDQGIGIPDEKRKSIFEPFFQVDSGSTRVFGGTGLGLSLARSYVVAHGGFLWAENRKDGRGSTFTFTLPAVVKELESYVEQSVASTAEESS